MANLGNYIFGIIIGFARVGITIGFARVGITIGFN